jgi:multidrug transporter EmrE-like cation transporter
VSSVVPAGSMPLVLPVLAALAFTAGGIFMKYADGMRHVTATFLFLIFFVLGAAMLSYAMRGAELGTTYIVVLGIEAALALIFGIVLFSETITVSKMAGVLLIVGGIALLRGQL